MLGEILIAIPIVLLVCVMVWYIYKTIKGDSYDRGDNCFISAVIAVVLVFVIFLSATIYSSAIILPYEYEAACNTIEETKELLTTFEDDIGLGQGLEALQLKQTLSNVIQVKNNKWAEIQSWLHNPWMPFKGVIEDTLTTLNI